MKNTYLIPIVILAFCSCRKDLLDKQVVEKQVTEKQGSVKQKATALDFQTIDEAWNDKYADQVTQQTIAGITTVSARFDFIPMGTYGFPYHYYITFSFDSTGNGSIISNSLVQDPPNQYWGYGINTGVVTNFSMYTEHEISRTVNPPPNTVLYRFNVTCTTQYYSPGVVYAWIRYKRIYF